MRHVLSQDPRADDPGFTGAPPEVAGERPAASGRLVVASTGTLRLDQDAPAGPPHHRALVPAGISHAATLGGTSTLCGLSVRELTVFPGISFHRADFLLRCGRCLSRLS